MSELAADKKEEMKRVVIDALTQEFKKPEAQSIEDIAAFSKGLAEGREMELIILTGGLCNFSYKLHFKDCDPENDVALFAKLTFGTPVLFPDVACSPLRTNYEFKMMEMYAKASPYPQSVVTPYLCFDLEGSEENMKVIVMQFSSRLEEQCGNLFIDGGIVDKAYATKIAKSLSALHNIKVTDPDFNGDMKEFFTTLSSVAQLTFEGYLDESNDTPDRSALKAREIGKEGLDEIMDTYLAFLMRTDCYVHGDCHVFNMLVASTLQALSNEDESAKGDVAIVDFEFAHYGPMGKDLGWVQVFPMACVMAHTINGDAAVAQSIVEFFDCLWETYAASVSLEGKDLTVEDLYRQTVASLGLMLLCYSCLGVHMEYLPFEEGNEEDVTKVRESLGVLALEFFEMGFLGKPEGATLAELRKGFKDAVQKEIDLLTPVKPKPVEKRRSSLLRDKKRRVSDSHTFFSMAADVSTIAEDAIMESAEFSLEGSEELMATYFGTRKESYEKFPTAGGDRSRRSCRISTVPRISLAITDLKRKSVCKWDNLMADFAEDFDDLEF